MFVTMQLKLQKLKSNILPFGEINIMFMEDFLQFPPITNTSLYSKNVQPTFAFTKMTQKKIIRKNVWENYIHLNNIILIKINVTKQDIQYAYIVENLRTFKITNSNFKLLKIQFFSNLKLNLFEICG
jgi:hypothetical protein